MEISREEKAKLKALEYASERNIVNKDVIDSYIAGYTEASKNPMKVTELLEEITSNIDPRKFVSMEHQKFYKTVLDAIEYGKQRGI